VDEGVVEAGHQVEGFRDPGRIGVEQFGELDTEHQRTASVAGNQCSSGTGAVVSGSSR
jgi:hypothetical protein